MNTPSTQTDDRYAQLARANARWRLLAVSSVTLMVGVVIGGTGRQPDQSGSDPKAVVSYVGTGDRIFRVHEDGSLTYLKIPGGERTGQGYFTWGDVRIDTSYKSMTMPQP